MTIDRRRPLAPALILLAVLNMAGCATLESELAYQTREHARSEDPDYLRGFEDGCTSGYALSRVVLRADFTQDKASMQRDPRYASGWEDGRAACNYPGGSPTFFFHR